MRPDNTRFLIQAAHQRSQATRQRAIQALRDLAATGDPITFQTIARTASVSRSWLYAQPDLRAELERLRARRPERQPRRRSQPNSAPPTPPCGAGWRPSTPRSAGCAPRTTSSANSSPARSGNAEP